MVSRIEIESRLKQLKPELAEKFYVSRIGYFGSYSKGEQTESSDLDILVEFSQPIGWKFFTLERFLEQTFGLKVDLVTVNALKEHIKGGIIEQVRYI